MELKHEMLNAEPVLISYGAILTVVKALDYLPEAALDDEHKRVLAMVRPRFDRAVEDHLHDVLADKDTGDGVAILLNSDEKAMILDAIGWWADHIEGRKTDDPGVYKFLKSVFSETGKELAHAFGVKNPIQTFE